MKNMSDTLPSKLRSYIEKSNVALAVSSASDDVPLILVNDAFCTLTGYSAADVIGHNCRFLQGDETDPDQQKALHDFVFDDTRDSGRFPILNYRKDGSSFLNLVLMNRLRGRDGVTRFILASQFDMTSSQKRRKLETNDVSLRRNLSEIDAMGQEFGLAMEGSAEAIADSIALLARMSLDE